MADRLTTVTHRTHTDSGRHLFYESPGIARSVVLESGLSLQGIEDATAVSMKEQGPSSPLPGQTASTNESVFNLINAVLGVGVLGFPYAFKTCGIGLATVLVILIASATLFSVRLLLISSQLTGKKSYEEIARHLYGKPGQLCINFCILVINLGAIVSYLNVLADVLSSVSGTIIPPALEPSRNSVLLGITVLAVLPVSVFIQDAAGLACVSYCSVTIIFIFTLVMTLSAMRPMTDLNVIHYWETSGMFVSFPVIAYGFTIHTVIFPVYSLLHAPTLPKMNKIVKNATGICGMVYFFVGAGGYLTFGDRTHGDILRNLGAPDSATGQTMRGVVDKMLKLAYGASIVGTVPLVILPSLSLLLPMLDPCWGLSHTTTRRLIASAFISVSYACAVLIPNVEFILGLNGGTSSVLVSYIMPALLYLRASSRAQESAVLKSPTTDGWLKTKARALFVMGIALGFLCTSATLRAVQEQQEVVNLVQNLVDTTKELKETTAVGQQTIHAARAVDAVQSAHKEIGDVQGDTAETLYTLHKTAKDLNATLGSEETKKTGFLQITLTNESLKKKKQATEAYKNVLSTIAEVVEKVQATLHRVETLQDDLKSLGTEIKQERDALKTANDADLEVLSKSEGKVDSFVKDLTSALGIAVDQEKGTTAQTLDAVQNEFKVAIDALNDTLSILDRVESIVKSAMAEGKAENSVKELVVSAMTQAIHATRHSALALNLTSNALSHAADSQKSEVIQLLSVMVKDAEHEWIPEASATTSPDIHAQNSPRIDVETAVNLPKENALKQPVAVNVSHVEAVVNHTTVKIKEALSEAHAAVRSADPKIASQAHDITKVAFEKQQTVSTSAER